MLGPVFFVAPRRIEVAPVQLAEPGEKATWSSAPSTRESVQAASCSPTGERSIRTFRWTRPSAPWGAPSDTRSATDTAASDESSAATGALTEGDLVFAFHPHQDRFVVPADEVIALADTIRA